MRTAIVTALLVAASNVLLAAVIWSATPVLAPAMAPTLPTLAQAHAAHHGCIGKEDSMWGVMVICK